MTQSSTTSENIAFSDLGLSDKVLEAVNDLGYTDPTPIQAQAIPRVLAGDDLLAAAQTGTGKTAAFLLPAMSRLPRVAKKEGKGRAPRLLVVTPTRELAQQIAHVSSAVQKRTGHVSVTVVGGVGYEPQREALKRGCDVLVATPGRLVDLIEQGDARLGQVEVLVLDEADRMLDMGFLPQMRKIVAQTPDSRQTLLFSATLDEEAIGGIKDLVRDPVTVEIAHKGTVAETIDQYVLPVSLEAKNGLLAEVLASEGAARTIVFTRTKHRADACCRRLRKAGITCAPIHGNRNQNQRERALKDFRRGKVDVLVATDVLARGIDVSDVRYVINFDVPADPEDYIHRIGRTGRAGETGWALTFVTENDVEDLFGIERLMGQVVPAYEPNVALELGENPVELDPERTTDGPVAGKKGKAKQGGGRRRGKGRAEGKKDGSAKGATKNEAKGNAKGCNKACAKPEANNSAKKQVAAGNGDSPAASSEDKAPRKTRRRRSSRRSGDAREAKAPASETRPIKNASEGRKQGASEQRSSRKPAQKRRVGDKLGRAKGVY